MKRVKLGVGKGDIEKLKYVINYVLVSQQFLCVFSWVNNPAYSGGNSVFGLKHKFDRFGNFERFITQMKGFIWEGFSLQNQYFASKLDTD